APPAVPGSNPSAAEAARDGVDPAMPPARARTRQVPAKHSGGRTRASTPQGVRLGSLPSAAASAAQAAKAGHVAKAAQVGQAAQAVKAAQAAKAAHAQAAHLAASSGRPATLRPTAAALRPAAPPLR
ncbi:MAG TPA: hypothetical protein VHN80_31840, partial [Kineosporiaceae bacterium]|nr:hypothetical protein [Kineosporiaceae bacterium]